MELNASCVTRRNRMTIHHGRSSTIRRKVVAKEAKLMLMKIRVKWNPKGNEVDRGFVKSQQRILTATFCQPLSFNIVENSSGDEVAEAWSVLFGGAGSELTRLVFSLERSVFGMSSQSARPPALQAIDKLLMELRSLINSPVFLVEHIPVVH